MPTPAILLKNTQHYTRNMTIVVVTPNQYGAQETKQNPYRDETRNQLILVTKVKL